MARIEASVAPSSIRCAQARPGGLGCHAMFVFKAAVVGAGVMGGEIAQVIASADVPVVLKDVDPKFVEAGLRRAREVTQGQVARLAKKGKLTEEQAAEQVERTLSLITGTTSYDAFGDVDFVIEAVPEKLEVKHAVFAEIDAATPGHAILASNTSGLSITEIADATSRPEKVVGFHFFWPASAMRLIEVVEGDDTSPETTQAAASFAQAIRKTAVRCADSPGFVVNRILVSCASEIWRYQDESGIPVEQLDAFVTERADMPMGPFRVADMSGLDTVVKVARELREAYGDRMYVHRGMEERVGAGDLGAKTGKGFYDHG
jgi:3-hydroxyacyl-CoA dehydrogenase